MLVVAVVATGGPPPVSVDVVPVFAAGTDCVVSVEPAVPSTGFFRAQPPRTKIRANKAMRLRGMTMDG